MVRITVDHHSCFQDIAINWEPWIYSDEEKKIASEKKRELPEIELGSMQYSPGWANNIRFNIVVKRMRVEKTTLFQQDGYSYYGVMTNIDLFYTAKQWVMEHHHKRGNSENFLREKKKYI